MCHPGCSSHLGSAQALLAACILVQKPSIFNHMLQSSGFRQALLGGVLQAWVIWPSDNNESSRLVRLEAQR